MAPHGNLFPAGNNLGRGSRREQTPGFYGKQNLAVYRSGREARLIGVVGQNDAGEPQAIMTEGKATWAEVAAHPLDGALCPAAPNGWPGPFPFVRPLGGGGADVAKPRRHPLGGSRVRSAPLAIHRPAFQFKQ